MEWSSCTNSHSRWPAVSGGGRRRFSDDVSSEERERCSLARPVSSIGPWGCSWSRRKKRRRSQQGCPRRPGGGGGQRRGAEPHDQPARRGKGSVSCGTA
jgi:hypothetical protein